MHGCVPCHCTDNIEDDVVNVKRAQAQKELQQFDPNNRSQRDKQKTSDLARQRKQARKKTAEWEQQQEISNDIFENGTFVDSIIDQSLDIVRDRVKRYKIDVVSDLFDRKRGSCIEKKEL